MDGNDYSVFAVLPPYNIVHAQLLKMGEPTVPITTGATITYEFTPDTTGSINTISSTKTNLWSYSSVLFHNNNPPDVGLTGNRTQSLTPRPLRYDSRNAYWTADDILTVPYDDQGRRNAYSMAKIVARDKHGTVLATAKIVLAVSDEMSCSHCHASNSDPYTKPAAGWENNSNPAVDVKLNILRKHDDRWTITSQMLSQLLHWLQLPDKPVPDGEKRHAHLVRDPSLDQRTGDHGSAGDSASHNLCAGVTTHEAWCSTQNVFVQYAFRAVLDNALTIGDTLILHALGEVGLIFARCQQTLAKGGAERLAKCEAIIEKRTCVEASGTSFASKSAVTRSLRNSEHEEVKPLPGKPTQTTAKERGQWKPTQESLARRSFVADVVAPFPNPQPFPTVHKVGAGHIAGSYLPPL